MTSLRQAWMRCSLLRPVASVHHVISPVSTLHRHQQRLLHCGTAPRHGSFEKRPAASPDQVVNLTFIDRKGENHAIKGKVGDNLMYLAHAIQDKYPTLTLEGACEASLACSTCHVIIDPKFYPKIPDPVEKEDDMLDAAACLTETSRLACQVILSKELDGMTIKLPAFSKNFYVDGHVPTPH
eukprot:gb/GEZN01020019.1/.p1 GENE.gb/GEZN01020019.1/~~gb/GEZN01020019.1/.p1  ORF type:complete len:182 (+),score=15.87 gb/GEZN01020019.1/:73-618(+)